MVASALGVGVSIASLGVALGAARRTPTLVQASTALACGALIAAAIVHAGVALDARRLDLIGWGLVGFALAHWFARALSRPRSQAEEAGGVFAVAALVMLSLHSVIDGVTLAVTATPPAGAFGPGVFGLITHEAPETLIAFAIVRRTGLAPIQAAAVAFCVAALTTLVGAAAGRIALSALDPTQLAPLVFVSAGMLAYLGWRMIAALVNAPRRSLVAAAFVVGAAASYPLLLQAETSGRGCIHIAPRADDRPVFRAPPTWPEHRD